MLGGYQDQGDLFSKWLFPDTTKPPASVFCAQFSDEAGTLCSPREICTTPYHDSIEFTAYLQLFSPTHPKRQIEPCHEAGGRRYSQPGTISCSHIGLIQDSRDAPGLGQGNIPIVSEDVVDTYS